MRSSGLLTVLVSLLVSPILRAESRGPEAPKPSSQASAAAVGATNSKSSGCSLSGIAIPDLDLQVADADGRPVARFGGVALPLTLNDLPDKSDGKVSVVTDGTARMHISGFVPVRSIKIYLKQDLPVIKGHITLLKGTAVEFGGRTGNYARISVRTSGAVTETYDTTVACDALTVEPQKANPWSPPRHARGYLMKQAVAPLFDKPGNDAQAVSSIHLAKEARGVLFYGDRREGAFIHVQYRRDVGIDGWMSGKDLEILPRGEVVDQSMSKFLPAADKRLQMKTEAQLYRASEDIALYGKADAKLPPIGAVGKDAEFYVLDVVVGWASILPRQLDIVPLSERHFWVRASDIGL
ncbi:MAG TPA: hypothetical protein VIV60_19720 [Polyangiaceae bacterium]